MSEIKNGRLARPVWQSVKPVDISALERVNDCIAVKRWALKG